MSKLSKIMLCPYFGPFPEWMDLFLSDFTRTMKPQGYELLLDTDLTSFKERVKEKLGIDFPGVRGSGKVHDYRACLGFLYKEEIEGYDYYGTVDFDVIFGNVSKWLPDEVISRYDLISSHDTYISGPFSLYKNDHWVRMLFQKVPLWEQYLIRPEVNGWVEVQFSRALENSSLKYLYSFIQGDPYSPPFNLKKVGINLFQDGVEIPLLHFRRDKRWPL